MKAVLPRKIKDSCLCARIMKSVRARGRGAAFTGKDFEAFGKPDAIRQALSRLVKRGKIRRVARGIYDWPRTLRPWVLRSRQMWMPLWRLWRVTTARRFSPPAAQAANRLGLSTQVPARDAYLQRAASHRIIWAIA